MSQSADQIKIGTADVISDVLDKCRLWQLRAILIIFLTKIPTAFFMAAIIYSAPVPQRVRVYCREGSEGNVTTILHPAVADVNDQEFELSLCDTYKDVKEHAWMYFGHYLFQMPWMEPTNETNAEETVLPCDIFDFKSGNPVTSYDVVCSRGALVVLTQGMHLVGILLSGVVARYSMKIMSPKTVLRLAMLLQISCGLIAGVVESLIVHLVFRALAAIGCAAAFTAGFVIVSDITTGKWQKGSQIFFDLFWSIGIVILSFITQYEARWTQLYMIISPPTFVILILTIWVPESPRWLLQRGHIDEVKEILLNASNFISSTAVIPVTLKAQLQLQANSIVNCKPASWFELWRTSTMEQIRIFCIHVAFACFTIMYFGMVLNMPNYGRHFLSYNALLIAASEVIGCFIGYVLATTCSVKFFSSGLINLLGAGIALQMWHWRDVESEFYRDGTLLYFCLVLKASVSCSFGVLVSCSTDLVTQRKKQILMFSCLLCGRIWLLNAPVMVSIGNFYGEFLSLTLFSITGIIGGLAMILVQMTLNVKTN
ncbi:solute carrier family 22 member 7-like [Culicoides brevitarsis]|uniref:solute carrier family 22 member 7-like n=1 Tax=Culicoides brevitarsis TaxID=469753 RepID=UPI00307B530D